MSAGERGTARSYVRKLSFGVVVPGAEARESIAAGALESARAQRAHARAIEAFERESGARLDPRSRERLDRLFLVEGTDALARIRSEGADAALTEVHQDALEAIVETDGSRPTVALGEDDGLDLSDATLGAWKAAATKFADRIAKVAAAVGRIDLDGQHCGTGFLVQDALILTNRHVLQGLADEVTPGNWRFRGEPSVTFDASPDRSRVRRFPIRKAVIRAGPEPIDPYALDLDLDKLDFAVLEIERPAGARLPDPLALESDADKVVTGRPVFTVGYPARPPEGSYSPGVLDSLFRFRYGVKRFAPGEIDRGLGSRADHTGEAVFAHDSTTLAGSSGSCVVDLGNDGRLAVGLHFGGRAGAANYAHSNARLSEALTGMNLTWKAWSP